MTQAPTLFDALNNRRNILVRSLSKDSVRNNYDKLASVARELREISKRLEVFIKE